MSEKESLNFIEQIIEEDIKSGKHKGRVLTRFPPEPNGYLHIGHAKSICLNFGIAQKYGGLTNLRFDDTNPVTEETEYVDGIKEDIKWLGFDCDEREFFASDYFQFLYDCAIKLIKKGLAYVDDSTSEEMANMKGSPTNPGDDSPFRNRSVSENLEIFNEMKRGEHKEGSKALRAKIDMSNPNMHMRDPVIYRIKYAEHHRTGDKWNIYPMYDFAHGLSDSYEQVTHSLCTLEFENHRPLYDWFLEVLNAFPSRQIEFARLNVNYTITSKRKLLKLVEEGLVSGWDDPRMPTIAGMRRRGYSPSSIRNFVNRVGIAKRENLIDISLLEFSVREDLNKIAQRRMVVLDPLKIVISNYPADQTELLPTANNPENAEDGVREMPFSREIYIEKSDFLEEAPRKFFRLKPGGTVRLKNAYIIQCDEVIKNQEGEVEQLVCSYFKESKSGQDTSGIKTKGTLHWVNAGTSLDVEIRIYDRLFNVADPLGGEEDYTEHYNQDSLQVLKHAKAEPSLASAKAGEYFQFLRKGYFTLDPDSNDSQLVFNLSVTLRDNWTKSKK
jgi:glutaminyl-tRNA synthetase